MIDTLEPEVESKLDSYYRLAADPHRIASARWLLERIPGGSRRAAKPMVVPIDGTPVLQFAGPNVILDLWFKTPHVVYCDRFNCRGLRDGQTTGLFDECTYNLAMNLQEITDLIRDTLEGSPCPDS